MHHLEQTLAAPADQQSLSEIKRHMLLRIAELQAAEAVAADQAELALPTVYLLHRKPAPADLP